MPNSKFKYFLALFFTAIIINHSLRAQEYKITNQAKFKPYFPELLSTVNKPKDGSLIIVRFWHRSLHDTINHLVVLEQATTSSWLGQQYTFSAWTWDKFRLLSRRPVTFDAEWPETWQALLAHNFLSLESEKQAKKHWILTDKKYITLVSDGDAYCIELLVKNKKRSYVYSNPETLADIYKPNADLINITYIITTLNAYFNLY